MAVSASIQYVTPRQNIWIPQKRLIRRTIYIIPALNDHLMEVNNNDTGTERPQK